MTDHPRIKLLPSGMLALLLPGPQGDNVEVELPQGQEGEALTRILAHQQKGGDKLVGAESPSTRFWLMHFERHRGWGGGTGVDPNCPWCAIEQELPHPVTKLPMGASAFGPERKAAATNKSIEELGL